MKSTTFLSETWKRNRKWHEKERLKYKFKLLELYVIILLRTRVLRYILLLHVRQSQRFIKYKAVLDTVLRSRRLSCCLENVNCNELKYFSLRLIMPEHCKGLTNNGGTDAN